MIDRETFADLVQRNLRLREALETISDVAKNSEGTHWYAWVADTAILEDRDYEPRRDVRASTANGAKKKKD